MKKHIFLTGDIRAGKSTAILKALGENVSGVGGFLTRRNVDEQGKPISFSLETLEGKQKAVFLDFSSGSPRVFMNAFETLGITALRGNVLVLDEIGGVELLSPAFWQALETVLKSDIPILGVVKGKNPSNSLVSALGLSEEYQNQWEKLWNFLCQDENTLVYSCGKYDEKAMALAKQWVMEYCQ